ncbi:squalene/phytoene synthase family protein [Streptosporangium lutulentum]
MSSRCTASRGSSTTSGTNRRPRIRSACSTTSTPTSTACTPGGLLLPAVGTLAPTVETCSIPAQPFRRLVEANRRDQLVSRYDTFDDLLTYCELSANPVGHIVLHVFGMADPSRLALSDRVCTALQIIEHCQDVGEDHARGRVYLPGEDLRRFGCVESDLAGTTTPTRLRGVVALQTERAGRLLNEGDPLISSMTGFARVAVAATWRAAWPPPRRWRGPVTTFSGRPCARAARGC